MADVNESFLGIGWPAWGGLAAASWVLLFAASWFGLLRGWSVPDDPASLWVPGIGLGFATLANGLPGTAAVLRLRPSTNSGGQPHVRARLLEVPEAAALASMTLSGAAGITCISAVFVLGGQAIWLVAAGITLGIVTFPLTFGLVFPLAIPLLCSYLVWSLAGRDGGISGRTFTWLTGFSAVGWFLVVVAGVAVGSA